MRRAIVLGALAGLFGIAADASGHFASPTHAPVGRLLTNAEQYVREHPDDSKGHYVLGRIHGLAFTRKSQLVAVWTRRDAKPGDLPEIADDTFQGVLRLWVKSNAAAALTEKELLGHLEGAERGYERAIALDDKPAAAHLGLAYVLEQGVAYAHRADLVPAASDPDLLDADARAGIERHVSRLADDREGVRRDALEALRARLPDSAAVAHGTRESDDANLAAGVRELLATHWREAAIDAYWEAYRRSIDKDLTKTTAPLRGLHVLVGWEAGRAWARLVRSRGARSDEERERLTQVDAAIARLDALPASGVITPIILSLQPEATLDELLAPERVVSFDLDGDGRVERWPWIAPDTGLLVWDPQGRGRITSGRQLFGSVSWWMFPRDGYHAMDLLDDDRDGELAGRELDGVGVWFDRDGDGVSDPGEVATARALGIAGLATHATGRVGGCPANLEGVRLVDGRRLPSYDWITAPAPTPARRP